MKKKFKIKKNDFVQVMVGRDKGKQGKVLKIFTDSSKALVEGVGQVTRHIRPSQLHPSGSYSKNLPIHISNIALVDPDSKVPSKASYRINEDGTKVRYLKKTGNVLL